MGINIKSVSERAGVGASTVSYVINNDRRIAGDTRARVLNVIEELGYSPRLVARALSSKRNHVISFTISDEEKRVISSPYFPEILAGICEVIEKKHYALTFPVINCETVKTKGHFDSIDKKMIDGVIILSPSIDDPIISKIEEKNIPLVVVGRHPDIKKGYCIETNCREATYNAIQHLIETGYRRVAFIGGSFTFIFAQDRLEGYKNALLDNGIQIREDYILDVGGIRELEGREFYEAGYQGMKKVLSREPRPTAVFLINELILEGALRAVREMKLNIPADLALICFGDMPLFEYCEPTITAIRQPVREIGKQAAELLFKIIESDEGDTLDEEERTVMINSNLICRDSCGCKNRHLHKE